MRKVTAFIALAATGCQSWRVQSEPAPTVVSDRHPKVVRLTLKSGERIEMTEARVEGDSIVGQQANARRSDRIAVATADVERISTQYTSAVKSVFAVVAIVVAVAVIAGASAASSRSTSSGGSCQTTAATAPAA